MKSRGWARGSLVSLAWGVCLVVALPVATAGNALASWARVEWGGKAVEVAIDPERSSSLDLDRIGMNRWAYRGDTSRLIGKSYTVRLRNRTDRRVKVVIGIDGLNVYRKIPVSGRSSDVGWILSPRQEIELPGWQVDRDTAREFVFTPPEFSSGESEREIGILSVGVYEEYIKVARVAPYNQLGRSKGSMAPDAEEGMGTGEGSDLDNQTRTVSFRTMTTSPVASGEIYYGKAASPRHRDRDQLGVRLQNASGGVRVADVESGSLAEEAGIMSGDLITKVDNVRSPDTDDFLRVLRNKRGNDRLFLEIVRGPHKVSMQIRL
jgi:hypothetical protein